MNALRERFTELWRRDDEPPTIELVAASAADGNATLEVELGVTQGLDSRWQLRVHEVLETRLTLGAHWSVAELDDHPLLADVLDRRAELYFRGPIADQGAFLGDLLRAHHRVMGEWRPISPYLNPALWTTELLSAGTGVLAAGPDRLIDAYEKTLREHDSFSNRLDQGPPLVWTGDLQWRLVPWPPKLLLLDCRSMGPGLRALEHTASYVIGRAVVVARLP
jgi:hypothetical protein